MKDNSLLYCIILSQAFAEIQSVKTGNDSNWTLKNQDLLISKKYEFKRHKLNCPEVVFLEGMSNAMTSDFLQHFEHKGIALLVGNLRKYLTKKNDNT